MESFSKSKAHGKLLSLAARPYDLTRSCGLRADGRLSRYICRSELLNLYYATQRVDSTVLATLQELADELRLVEQFKEMRRGAVLNRIIGYPSENRQVLHTACRDVFADPAEPVATAAAKREIDKLQAFLRDLEKGRIVNEQGRPFDTMIQVGIGGSDLGPRSVFEALKYYGISGRKVFFLSNVDPDDCAQVLGEIDLGTTLVNIVSKSGTTLETLTNEKFIRGALKRAGLDPVRHCISVTGKNSPMDDTSRYLRSFYMYGYVGGRYSTTSMVGGVILGFYLGFSQLKEFLKGASTVDREAENKDILKNVPLLLALLGIWNRNFLGYPTLAVLPYNQPLHRFPAHLQQCDMESNGKSVDRYGNMVDYRTGPIVWGEPGTNGQHAFYQSLHQGTEIVPVEFIGFMESQNDMDMEVEGSTSQQKLLANLYGQIVAMAVGRSSDEPNKSFPGNRPSSLLFAKKLTPMVMGALLAVYEAKIVFQGFAWNINSFDQEGVELGKVLARQSLEELVAHIGDGEEELYQHLLAYLSKNPA